MNDPYNLQRFVQAQDGVMEQVYAELGSGAKTSHWMWFVFPQIAGLGQSPMARQYAISSLDEARAYAAHPLLGDRLRACTELVNRTTGRSAEQIFGYPDVLKFHSCMTLFACAEPDEDLFRQAMQIFYDGRQDSATLERLGRFEPPAHTG